MVLLCSQATAYFAASKTPSDAKTAVAMYAVSLMMVVGQSMTTAAMVWGMSYPTCSNNDMCSAGRACISGGTSQSNRCGFCGETPPVLAGQTYSSYIDDPSHPLSPDFPGFNNTLMLEMCEHPVGHNRVQLSGETTPFATDDLVAWCAVCIHPTTGAVDRLGTSTLMAAHYNAMRTGDMVALGFASTMVSFAVMSEIKDAFLVSLTIDQFGDQLSIIWRVMLKLCVCTNGPRRMYPVLRVVVALTTTVVPHRLFL